jgi:putative ABC transport system permease protein
MMLVEAGFLAATGIALGALASLATVLSYSWVRQDRLVPDLGPWYFLAVAAAATLVTVGATRVLTRKALSESALTAAAGNQGD